MNVAAKRLFDILVSGVVLVVLSPLVALVALFIRWSSDGPVFHRGRRIGRGGAPFSMLKFRTMIADAAQRGGTSTPADDPRITRIGGWLRRYKLDELPQLYNVLIGEMSLVGPRPQVEWAVSLYTDAEREVLSVRPGITDPASLRFSNEGEILRGEVDPDRAYLKYIHPEKMRMSLAYIRHQSFFGDLKIIFQTVLAAGGVVSYAADPVRLKTECQ